MPEIPSEPRPRAGIDARLASFGATTPGLTAPDAARRRGNQRTRRARVLLGGAGVVVLAGALAGGVLLSGGGADRVSIPDVAATPTSNSRETPTASPSPQPSPSASGSADPVPSRDAASRTAYLTAALIDGGAISRALGVDDVAESDGYPVTPHGCNGTVPLPADAPQFPVGGDRVTRGFQPGGAQELIAYRTEADARTAYDLLITALRRCPKDSAPTEFIVGGLQGASLTRTYLHAVDAELVVPIAVEQIGRVISTVSAPFVKDLDWPRRPTPLPALADEAAKAVRAAGLG